MKAFEDPTMKIVKFEAEDIVTTSFDESVDVGEPGDNELPIL